MNLHQHLTRVMTRGRDFVPQIDGLRFVAIIGVLAYHVYLALPFHYQAMFHAPVGPENPVTWTFAAGCKGVELFFVISGFVLVLPFARHYLGQGEPVRLKAYYLRRLTRLEPPYLIQLVFVFLVTWLFLRHQPRHVELYHQPDWLTHTLRHLGVSLFYGSGFVYGAYPEPNIVLWSLEIEVQFYLVAPLLAAVFLIRPAPARRLTIMALMLLPLALEPLLAAVPWLGWTLLGKLQFLMAGFLFCDLFLDGRVKTDQRSHAWDAAFLAALVAVVFLNRYHQEYPFLPWLGLLCCVAAFRGKIVHWLLGHPFLTTIGGMCYTLYMYHWLMISGLIRGTLRLSTHIFWLDLLIQFVVMSAIIIPICVGLFALFERPFMQRNWPQKIRAWATKRKAET